MEQEISEILLGNSRDINMGGEYLQKYFLRSIYTDASRREKEGVMNKSEKFFKIYSLGLILTLILLGGLPLGASAADTIKIGVTDAYSGPIEHAGRMYLCGTRFAVDEQNAKGGLLGRKIELLEEDNEYKPDIAIRKAKKLIMEDGVDILGAGNSGAIAIVLNKLATDHKKIFINYGAMTDLVQGREFSRYGFRVVQQNSNAYAAFGQFLSQKPYRRFYLLGPDYVHGHDSSKMFRKYLKQYVPDATVVGEDFHPIATKDFGPYITKVIAAKPDLVFLSSFPPDLPNFIKQARAMGLKKPFPFMSMFAVEPYVMNELKDDAVGLIYAHQFSLMVKTPEMESLINDYHAQHKNDKDFLTWWPFPFIGQVITGWRMTFAAIEKAGSLDPEKIIETFEGFQWQSPLGTTYTMRECDHQALLPMYVGVVSGEPNPYFNGSIRPEVNFPYEGPVTMFPIEEVAFPATPDYNPRCK